MKKHRTLLLLALICALSFYFKSDHLTTVPAGFYNDESLFGYEAYSLLKTGNDEFGRHLPLFLKAFGDYRPGLYSYAIIPFIALFQLSVFSVRITSVVLSTATIIPVYYLTWYLWKNRRIALFAAFFYALTPSAFLIGRIGHEANLATLLITLGLCLLYRAIDEKKAQLLPLTSLILGISIYAYYSPRIFLPLFLLGIFFLQRNFFLAHKKMTILTLCTGLLILIPFFYSLMDSNIGWSRVRSVSLWGDPGLTERTHGLRWEDSVTATATGRLFHNKLVVLTRQFVENYLTHVSPDFLLFSGDPNHLYTIPDVGIIYYFELLFILCAGLFIIKKNQATSFPAFFLISWILIGIFPDALTRLVPALPRIHLILPALAILSGYGMVEVLKQLNKTDFLVRTSTTVLLVFFVAGSVTFAMHQYFSHLNVRDYRQWHAGLSDVIAAAEKERGHYEKIWYSDRLWGWINVAFFTKYPPAQIQKELQLGTPDEYGLAFAHSFGPYIFDVFTATPSAEYLYVGKPTDFPLDSTPSAVITNPWNSLKEKDLFWLVPGANFATASAQIQ